MHKRKILLAVIKVFLCEVSAHLVYWNDIQHALSAFKLHKDYLYTFSWHSRPERHARLQNSRLSNFRNVISTAQVRRGKETVRKPRFLLKKNALKNVLKTMFRRFMHFPCSLYSSRVTKVADYRKDVKFFQASNLHNHEMSCVEYFQTIKFDFVAHLVRPFNEKLN